MQICSAQLSRCILACIKLQKGARYLIAPNTPTEKTIGRRISAQEVALSYLIPMLFLFKIRVVDNRILIKDIIYMKETKRVAKERYDETKQSLSLSNLRDSWKDLIGTVQTSNLKSLTLSKYFLTIGGNSITDSHINYLTSFDFDNLSLLWLSKFVLIQTTITYPKTELQS